jgi:hypothetical protein
MTGWGAERQLRTAHRPREVRSAGRSTLMPPPSQGAERRRKHRSVRSGSRWGLCALVIASLAVVIRLLTRPAVTEPPQAADQPRDAEDRQAVQDHPVGPDRTAELDRTDVRRDPAAPIRLTGGRPESRDGELCRPAPDGNLIQRSGH